MNKPVILGETNKNTLITYLKSLNNTTELEIRFGTFVYSDVQKSNTEVKHEYEFQASVDIEFFYRLKMILDNQKGLSNKIQHTKELIYENAADKRGKIRRINYTNEPFEKTEYVLKNTYRQHNIFDYDCRISLSSEKILEKDIIRGVDFEKPSFIRYKKRISYYFESGILDMTIVKQGKTEEDTNKYIQYEIEFEIKKNDYNSIIQIMSFILSVKQNNFYIINTREKRNIINQYRTLFMPNKKGYPYFVGAQPETLQKDQLSMLFKELYAVTDKADGERYFMFIDNNGDISFIDNNIINILKTNLRTSQYKNCIIDGELIRTIDNQNHNLSKICFYAFDLLYINNLDIRGDINYLLKQRLEHLNNIINTINSNELYIIKMKKYIYRNVFMGSEIIMNNINNQPYKNDGLIFTPMNEPYPTSKKWPKLLKWKPAELNTIDFYSIQKNENGQVFWELYVQDTIKTDSIKQYKQTRKTELVLFDINKLCNITEEKVITFKTTFDIGLIDPTTNEPFKSGTVIEYKWDGIKFVPLRTRWDKTANPSKHGNFSMVACSIWNNINNPITSEQLFQMTNTTTEQVNSEKFFFFERMKTFHNKINKYLINKYLMNNNLMNNNSVNNSEYDGILELNTFNQIQHKNTITFCNSIKQTNLNYKNFKLDLTVDNAPHIISSCIDKYKLKMSSIFCLKFNTFFKSQHIFDNFIQIVDYNIKKNGKLVLVFLDLKRCENSYYIKNNEILYMVNKKNVLDNQVYNNYIKLYVNGITSETVEYLVDSEYLIDYLKQKGYKCIENETYDSLYNIYSSDEINSNDSIKLNEYEKDISKLYRFCIFEKIESNILNVINNTMIEPYNPMNINLIEHKSLKFHKITSSYDIFNVLNCIHYTIFKNMYKNTPITTFQDIFDILNSIHKKVYMYHSELELPTDCKDYIYFHNYIFEEDTQSKDIKENNSILINQFYIVLYNNTIIQNVNTLKEIKQLLTVQKENKEQVIINNGDDKQQVIINNGVDKQQVIMNNGVDKQQRKEEIKMELSMVGNKITINVLKEYLKELNLKISGKKDELLQRLKDNLN